MLKDITRPVKEKHIEYRINFTYKGQNFDHGGSSFPCDKDGNILPMKPEAKKNYEYCISHPEDFEYANWFEVLEYTTIKPATGICSKCGNRIEIHNQYMGAFSCPNCDQWYSMSGDELLPPEKWEIDY